MYSCLYSSVLCNKLVSSAWYAYFFVLPAVSLYALKKGMRLKSYNVY